MSGVGLITSDTPLGRHMATRLARTLEGTGDPLRNILVLDAPAASPRRKSPLLRVPHRVKRLLSARQRLAGLVWRYEREASDVFLRATGPATNWPTGCEIRRLPRAEVNSAETVAWQAEFRLSLVVLLGAPIICEPMLRTASLGVLNLHGSLLPHYRGTRVEIWQIHNGDLDKTGLTIHFVEPGIDTGDIVAQVPQTAALSDGPWIIRARNQVNALDAMPRAVCDVLAGTAERRRQNPDAESQTYRFSDITPDVLRQVIAKMNRKPGA